VLELRWEGLLLWILLSPPSFRWMRFTFVFPASLGFVLFFGNPLFFLSREWNSLYISVGVFVVCFFLGQEDSCTTNLQLRTDFTYLFSLLPPFCLSFASLVGFLEPASASAMLNFVLSSVFPF
jgi:hypothetical protein